MSSEEPGIAIESASVTHPGLHRPRNEDSIASRPDLGLWVLADGIGGAAGGEVASRIVVETVCGEVVRGASLREAIVRANNEVLAAASTAQGIRGMGSTVVVLHLSGGRYDIAWVGDSRAYRWNGSGLVRLTRDHSLLQELIDAGTLSADKASRYPHLNKLNKSVGQGRLSSRDVEVTGGVISPGERVLLCSDGLYGYTSESAMADALNMVGPLGEIVDHLLELALAGGGLDNISIQLVGVDNDSSESSGA